MPEFDDAQTQPLPTATQDPHRLKRARLGPLAGCAAVGWLTGGALLATEYLPAAARAPRLVRGVVWAAACASIALGLAALACCTALVLLAAAMHGYREAQRANRERRRVLYTSGAPRLAEQRERLRAIAVEAASIERPQPGTLRVVNGERRTVARPRRGTAG